MNIINENGQIRDKAWRILWKNKWIWRLVSASILMQLACQTILNAIGILFDHDKIAANAEASGFVSNLIALWPSAALLLFIYIIISGIFHYGSDKLLNNAADGKDDDWLKAAFSGFKIPLGLGYLCLRMTLVFICWTIVLLLPFSLLTGMLTLENLPAIVICLTLYLTAFLSIPFYRYRYLFRIKADHPEWSAGKCLKHCRELTKGSKWRIFKHDCSYWKVLLIPLLLLLPISLAALVNRGTLQMAEKNPAVLSLCILVFSVIYLGFFATVMTIGYYNGIGQSLLYRKIENEKNKEDANP